MPAKIDATARPAPAQRAFLGPASADEGAPLDALATLAKSLARLAAASPPS